MDRRRWARLLTALIGLALLACAPALGQTASDVEMNERLSVPGDGQIHVYNFSPTANNVYTFRSFGEGQASAWLYLAGETEPIAQGEGFSFQARLIADATYQLRVRCGEGQVEVEMMRAALGRCFEQPIPLDDLEAGYAKAIARAYDTHWYRFTAPVSGTYSIRTHSRVNTVGYLLDETGRQLAVSDDLYNNYCLDFRIEYQLEAGKSYVLRVSARGSETGRYDLAIAVPQEGQVLPESCSVDQERVSLQEGQQVSLGYQVQPQGAMDDVVWVSANPRVATVDQNGLVTARSAGQAQIILAAMNGAQARCLVEVTPIPVTGLTVESASYTMYQGDTLTIPYQVEPADASSKAVIITSSDPQVVSVQSRGMLVAQEPGQAQITLSTIDGGYSRQVEVTVERAPSQYRALVMGMQRFDDGDYRLGAVNTTQGMYDLFSRQNYQSGKAQVTMRLDLTRAQAIAAIRSAFAQAKENDVSILYINTHGGLTGRTPWIKFSDGALLTAAQLEKELSKVKGTVVVLLDCCQSGAFISTATQRVFGTRFIQAFAAGSSGRLTSSKYRILASTSAAQDSFRLLPTQDATESNSSTAFSRSLCEAGGWDLMGDKRTALRADINQDQAVTLYEAYLYCSQRVNKYLENTSQTQDVQMYPMGSQLTLFHTG